MPEVEIVRAQRLNKSYKPMGMVTLYRVKEFGLYSILKEDEKTATLQFYKEVDPSLVNEGA